MRKRILAMALVVVMIFGLLSQNYVLVQAEASPNITVNVTNKLDVALAVGPTDVDYSNFAADLKKELSDQGNVAAEDVYVSELEASAVGTSSSFAWWNYDHTVGTVAVDDTAREYVEQTATANNNGHAYYSLDRHIIVTNGGADLGFRGYGSSGYKDFMYLTNEDPTKKTFQFDIQEGVAYDALDGVGFLFNTGVTGSYEAGNQLMTGYLLFLQYNGSGRGQEISLYKFINVNTKNFHQGNYGLIASTAGFTKLASSATYLSTDSFRKIRIEVQPKKVRVWYKGGTEAITQELTNDNIVNWSISGGGQDTEITIDPTNAYGFGPMSSYRSHGCTLLTSIDMKNLTMSTEEPKTLAEVIREPKWQSNSEKFIVNLNKNNINDFNNDEMMGEIINRLNSDAINYIGWGSDENEVQSQAFIQLNDQKGDFVNVDSETSNTYNEQIAKIAQAILSKYKKEVTGEIAYVLTSDKVNLTVDGAQTTGTEDENWPNGKWKIKHDITGFENTNSIYELNDQYTSDLETDFSLPGKYEIYYEDNLVKTIVANRKPVALFNVQVVSGSAITVDPVEAVSGGSIVVSGSAITVSGAAISCTDLSFDPDDQNGIDPSKTVWKYMNLSEQPLQWHVSTSPLSQLTVGDIYLVSLIVTDKFGETSIPYTRQISYSEEGAKIKPYADFALSTSLLVNGSSNQSINIIDKSYDVYNASIAHNFTITKDGQSYDKPINVGMNDFSNDSAGTYVITMMVTSENGTSEKVTRTLVIVRDEVAPTVSCNVANDTETGYSKIVLNFNDTGKSGLKLQRTAITDSINTPDENSLSWTEESSMLKRTIYMDKDGANYVHYYAEDNAGNEISGYFGPFYYEASNPYITEIKSPVNHSVNQSINGNISFQMSEKVVKGDSYLTIYNKTSGKKFVDIHSSNNRVKISDSGLVTVELPKVLEYNTEYYIVVGTNFLKDESTKPLAQFGDANDWSFQTLSNGVVDLEDEINITGFEIQQPGADEDSMPFVNVDKNNPKAFKVYVKAGEFTLKPILSKTSDKITIDAFDCTANLSEDKSKIIVDLQNNATDPYITFRIGENNSYTFRIIQTDKDLNARVESNIASVTTTLDNSSLLNVVDLTEDLGNNNIQKIDIRLLLNEPQSQQESDAVQAYITNNNIENENTVLFDASLLKRVTYNNSSSSESNITNTQEPIEIRINIPELYQTNYNYKILRNHGGEIEELTISLVNNSTQLSFMTDRFSTYAVIYTKTPANTGGGTVIIVDSNSGVVNEVIKEPEVIEVKKELKVPYSVSVNAGETLKLELQNVPKGAVIKYHVSTPTKISVNQEGVVFGKKASNGTLFVKVSYENKSIIYETRVFVQKSDKKATSVGFIQYYDELVTYKNVQYRITKPAKASTIGTVAVGNNQTNTKLPSKLIIPSTIIIKGKKYSVTSIDESAFYKVQTLKSVSIPKTVGNISTTAFTACRELKNFTVQSSNKHYSAKKGMLLNKKGDLLISYPSASGRITIDSKISTIGAFAFSVNKDLTEVTIPRTVKVIDGDAFAHTKSLEIIRFKGEVPTITYPTIFDDINPEAVIYVTSENFKDYKKAFAEAKQPTKVIIKKQ